MNALCYLLSAFCFCFQLSAFRRGRSDGSGGRKGEGGKRRVFMNAQTSSESQETRDLPQRESRPKVSVAVRSHGSLIRQSVKA